jgi:hypothetical protein
MISLDSELIHLPCPMSHVHATPRHAMPCYAILSAYPRAFEFHPSIYLCMFIATTRRRNRHSYASFFLSSFFLSFIPPSFSFSFSFHALHPKKESKRETERAPCYFKPPIPCRFVKMQAQPNPKKKKPRISLCLCIYI